MGVITNNRTSAFEHKSVRESVTVPPSSGFPPRPWRVDSRAPPVHASPPPKALTMVIMMIKKGDNNEKYNSDGNNNNNNSCNDNNNCDNNDHENIHNHLFLGTNLVQETFLSLSR